MTNAEKIEHDKRFDYLCLQRQMIIIGVANTMDEVEKYFQQQVYPEGILGEVVKAINKAIHDTQKKKLDEWLEKNIEAHYQAEREIKHGKGKV